MLDLEVIFALSNPSRTWDPKTFERSLGSAVIVYRAVVRPPAAEGEGKGGGEVKQVVTPVNLTHHWGFNLDASYAKPLGETPDVKNHKLYIDAQKIIKSDSKLLPVGELVDVQGTKFDFSTKGEEGGDLIGERYGTGYGMSFLLHLPSFFSLSRAVRGGVLV